MLDLSHLLRRHVTDHVAVADDVLPAPVSGPELLPHRLRQLEERTRLLTVVLAEHDFLLPRQLRRQEQRSAQRRGHEAERALQTVGGQREVVAHALFLGRAVEDGSQLAVRSRKASGSG